MRSLKTAPGQLAPDDKRITRKEARDLLTALDKPEFGGLMDDYLKEISDPNNVKETNQFLKESEEKKDLPANVRLAKPTPGFCIRSEKYSIKHPSQRKKIFINIVSLDEVQPPENDKNNMWKLPYLLNKGRHDQDKKGKYCTTFDVVFNPKAIELANDNLSFKKFVCDTAINGINDQILSKEEERISSDFVVKKFNYKGLEVSYVNVHTLNKGEMDDRKEPSEFHKTEIMKEVEKLKEENAKKEEEDVDVYDQPDIDNKDNVNDVIKTKKLIDKDSKEPVYKIKYSDNFEINNFFYNPQGYEEPPKHDYKKIIIEINTPMMAGASEAELEIDTKKLKFKYKDIYLLNLDLPIEINKDTTTAKFDKSKKLLILSADIIHKKQPIPEKKIDERMEIINEEEEKRKEEEKKKKEEEERIKKEMEEKQKKEEEAKKKLEEEEMRKKKEKEKKEKERLEKERLEKEKIEKEKKKKEEEEKNKEDIVFIKGQKNKEENSILKNNENILKEIKYKEEIETKKETNKKFVEEIIPENEKEEEIKITEDEINTTIPMRKQIELLRKNKEQSQKNADDKIKKKKEEKEIKKDENKKHDEDDIEQKPIENKNQNNTQNTSSNEDTRTPTCFLSFANDWIYDID